MGMPHLHAFQENNKPFWVIRVDMHEVAGVGLGGGGEKNKGNFDEENWLKGTNHEPNNLKLQTTKTKTKKKTSNNNKHEQQKLKLDKK
mgnify:CR=1 FL=1